MSNNCFYVHFCFEVCHQTNQSHTQVFDYPTISEICRYLKEESDRALDMAGAVTAAHQDRTHGGPVLVPSAGGTTRGWNQEEGMHALSRLVLDAVTEILGTGGGVSLDYDAPLMSSGVYLVSCGE